MITVRQIQRLWDSHAFPRLFRELLAPRPEASWKLEAQLTAPAATAALALIRLDELQQAACPLYGRLLRAILFYQQPDGSWGDPLTTALCLRALLLGDGGGQAIDRGLTFLAQLQKNDGSWPAIPIRRLPGDGFVTAFILYQLGDNPRFRDAVNFEKAITWFLPNEPVFDETARQLWSLAKLRCQMGLRTDFAPAMMGN